MANSEPRPTLSVKGHLVDSVPLPCQLPVWGKIKSALQQLRGVSSTNDLLPALGRVYQAAHPTQFSWHIQQPLLETAHPFVGLGHFLEHVASVSEQDTFFRRVLPTIAQLAGLMDRWSPGEGIPYSVQQQESVISLDRRLIASIIANAFLCTFPEQHNHQLNSINFEEFFQFLICSTTRKSQAAKLRCFLNYFDSLAETDMECFTGQVCYIRQVVPEDDSMCLENWVDSKAKLCPLTVRHTGLIEDSGSHALQVDFANRFIGGSTLLSGRQQEEIRFCTCPELLASLLFVESLQENEAIVMTGYEQFSSCSGYSSTLKFRDGAKKTVCNDLNNTLIAIDAMPWSGFLQNQFRPEHILRELNKAYVGFCYPMPHEKSSSSGQEEVDSSSFQDALDHSLLSTDGMEFETASSGDGHSRESSCSSSLRGYSSSLSRAITDIAIKDVSGSFPSVSLSQEESSQNSLSTVLTMSDASTPVKEVAQASGLQASVLENFAIDLIQNTIKEVQGEVEGRRPCTDALDGHGALVNGIPADSDRHSTPSNGNVQCQVKALVDKVISSAVDIVQTVNRQQYLNEREVGYSAKENSSQKSHIVGNGDELEDDSQPCDSPVAFKTLPVVLSNSQATPLSQGAESHSSKGSLADFSVISSCPSSDGFVQIGSVSDVTFGQRNANQAFSPDVLASFIVQDALTTLYEHIHLGIPVTNSNHSLDMCEIPSEVDASRDCSSSFDILTSDDVSSSPSLSDFVRVTSFSLDGLTEDIMSSAFQQLHQILQNRNVAMSGKFLDIDTNKNTKNTKSLSSKGPCTLNKMDEKDYLHFTKEDTEIGNTLLGVGRIDRGQLGTPGAITAERFVERLVSEALNESFTEAQAHSSSSTHHKDSGTPQPSLTQPMEIETYLHTSQSFDKSLVTISEQPVIEEPNFFGDKRLSADSSGTESSQSREARIRECAEQLVARTLPESMKLLGGSAQTTSSSSSRRTSSPRSSIPNSSNRSSMDCFTEDLLKIGNIDPMGKRPSRTEESLAFFAQEIKRMAEAEEKLSKKKKEDFADFNMELQRGSVHCQPHVTSPAPDYFLDNLAERCSVQVISDSFLHLYSKPWSEAKPVKRGGMVFDEQKPSRRLDVMSGQSCHPKENVQEDPCQHCPSEQDLLSMATNLANSIIEAALRVYKDKHLQLQSSTFITCTSDPSQTSPTEPRPSSKTNEDAVCDISTLHDFAEAKACVAIDDALLHLPGILKKGEMFGQGQLGGVPWMGRRAIATGNWGCGAFGGDPQLKSLIQWMVASQVQCPHLMYFTFGDERVSRLHRVVIEVSCRDWTVGDLMRAVLDHSWLTLNVDTGPLSLFEHIIGSI